MALIYLLLTSKQIIMPSVFTSVDILNRIFLTSKYNLIALLTV
jgi:hypothetical protein